MANILIVDDDPDVIDTIELILLGVGHNINKAQSGLSALDILDTDQPLDLMITDVVMPGLNGFNLALMARLKRPRMKILYLSAWHESRDLLPVEGRLGRMLTKPIPARDLIRVVEFALGEGAEEKTVPADERDCL